MWQTFLRTWEVLTQARPPCVLLAFLLFLVSLLIMGQRWNVVLSSLGIPVRWVETFLITLVGIMVNNLTPSSRMGGEACRILMLQKRDRIPAKKVALSAFLDRFTDLISISLLVLAALPALRSIPNIRFRGLQLSGMEKGLAGVAAAALTSLLIFFLVRKEEWLAKKIANWRSRLVEAKLDRKKLLIAIGLALLIWIQDLFRLMVVAAAFHVSLTVSQASALAVSSVLMAVVPSIGGLGVIEGGMTATLYLFGINLETAIAITALERGFSYVIATGIGAIAAAALGGVKLWNVTKSA